MGSWIRSSLRFKPKLRNKRIRRRRKRIAKRKKRITKIIRMPKTVRASTGDAPVAEAGVEAKGRTKMTRIVRTTRIVRATKIVRANADAVPAAAGVVPGAV